MIFQEMKNAVYLYGKDFAQSIDPLIVAIYLNSSQEQFNQVTGLYRVRTQLTITNGVGDLVVPQEGAVPGLFDIQGSIVRVEDANNNNKKLTKMTEEQMDTLHSPFWRLDTVGPLKYWLRGKANEGTQTAYETLMVYPLISTGTVNLFYVKKPPDLVGDADISVFPQQYHMAIVWHTVLCISPENAHAKEQYGEYLSKAQAEVSSWG